MANLPIFVVLLIFSGSHVAAPANGYASEPAEHHLELLRRNNEKFVKLTLYVQDALAGPNKTVYEVARASITANSVTSFGQVRVLDDKFTAGPAPSSKELGRTQGFITSSDLVTSALTMNLNFVFTAGKFNGSTLCIIGRNQIMDDSRELPVVGGSGAFRLTRGYAFSTTYSYDVKSNYGVLGYTIYASYGRIYSMAALGSSPVQAQNIFLYPCNKIQPNSL